MGCMQLELERVIGLTTTTANGLACNTASDELAYLAGCVVVVFNAKTNSQTHFLTAPRSPKAFACVAYSAHGGKFIAAGEVCHTDTFNPNLFPNSVPNSSVLLQTHFGQLKQHKPLRLQYWKVGISGCAISRVCSSLKGRNIRFKLTGILHNLMFLPLRLCKWRIYLWAPEW